MTAVRHILLSIALFAPAVSLADDTPPNVLLVIADDLGVADVGVYTAGGAEPGNPPPTPTIDALAASGVLFREAWAAPVCSPTRAALFTGRYGFRTGVRDVGGDLDGSETTFVELLGAAGYANGLFGKWHLGADAARGGDDAPRVTGGWDHFAGTLGGGLPDYFAYTQVTNGVGAAVDRYATTETVDDALAWITAQTGPWTCTLSLNAPHAPFHEPPAGLFTLNVGPNPADVRLYRAMIEALDTELGRLLAGLGPAADDTLIIFVGDNGTPQSVTRPPYTSGKGQVYQGGVHVPLIVAGPGVGAPGREVAEPVHVVDLFATLLDAAGIDAAAALPGVAIDGVSLRPLLAGAAGTLGRATVYTEIVPDLPAAGDFAIRGARYKLIERAGGHELYDLEFDPLETVELLAAGPTADELAAYDALVAALDALRATAGCAADLDGDGVVGFPDLLLVLGGFGAGAAGDVDGDGVTDLTDLLILLGEFGMVCA